jgi:hypothetical protein
LRPRGPLDRDVTAGSELVEHRDEAAVGRRADALVALSRPPLLGAESAFEEQA